MKDYSLKHLSDESLLCALAGLVARERTNTADLLAHIAEVEERRLYAPLAYDSMRAYCVDRLGLSEEAAAKRVHAANVARRYPVVLDMVADGRLHLSAVVTLGPALRRLPESDACALLHAAARKTRAEIEHLIACRLPREDAPALLQPADSNVATDAPGRLWRQRDAESTEPNGTGTSALSESETNPSPDTLDSSNVATDAPGRLWRQPDDSNSPELLPSEGPNVATDAPGRLRRPKEIAPGRFVLQATISREHHDMLRRAQELLSHQYAPADLAGVVERLIEEGLRQVERKLAATATRPGTPRRASSPRPARESSNPRHIPAEVRWAVRLRDGDRCTFVGPQGRRCEARHLLQFDHIVPVARGGTSTVGNVRLLCREHNRLEAERVFGREFMEGKRGAAGGVTKPEKPDSLAIGEESEAEARTTGEASAGSGAHPPSLETRIAEAKARAAAATHAEANDVRPYLRKLGYSERQAVRAAAFSSELADAPLEARMKVALAFLHPGRGALERSA